MGINDPFLFLAICMRLQDWRWREKTHASSPSTSGKTYEKTSVIQTRPEQFDVFIIFAWSCHEESLVMRDLRSFLVSQVFLAVHWLSLSSPFQPLILWSQHMTARKRSSSLLPM